MTDDLTLAQSPLAGRVDRLAGVAATTGGAVVIEHVPFLAQVDLRVDPAEAHRSPTPLPLEPNTVWEQGSRAVLWLGPNEWLILGAPGTAPEIVAELEAAFADVHHSVIDVSANRARVRTLGASGEGTPLRGLSDRPAPTFRGGPGCARRRCSDACRSCSTSAPSRQGCSCARRSPSTRPTGSWTRSAGWARRFGSEGRGGSGPERRSGPGARHAVPLVERPRPPTPVRTLPTEFGELDASVATTTAGSQWIGVFGRPREEPLDDTRREVARQERDPHQVPVQTSLVCTSVSSHPIATNPVASDCPAEWNPRSSGELVSHTRARISAAAPSTSSSS